MPPLEDTQLNDTAILWYYAGKDRFNKPRVHSPVEIPCHWEQIQNLQIDPQARTVQYDATVLVDRDVPENSILWFGLLADFVGTGSGLQEERLMSVDHKEFVTDLKGRVTYRQLILKRYMSAIPPII